MWFTPEDGGLPERVPLTIDFSTGFYFHREGPGARVRRARARARGRRRGRRAAAAGARGAAGAEHPGGAGTTSARTGMRSSARRADVSRFLYATGVLGPRLPAGSRGRRASGGARRRSQPTLDLSPFSAERFAAGAERPETFVGLAGPARERGPQVELAAVAALCRPVRAASACAAADTSASRRARRAPATRRPSRRASRRRTRSTACRSTRPAPRSSSRAGGTTRARRRRAPSPICGDACAIALDARARVPACRRLVEPGEIRALRRAHQEVVERVAVEERRDAENMRVGRRRSSRSEPTRCDPSGGAPPAARSAPQTVAGRESSARSCGVTGRAVALRGRSENGRPGRRDGEEWRRAASLIYRQEAPDP